MLKRGLFMVGAALILVGFLVATDASAARRGGHGARTHAVKRTHAASRTHAVKRTHRVTLHNNANFSANGPYIGLKFINH
jgi:hypothetical protein